MKKIVNLSLIIGVVALMVKLYSLDRITLGFGAACVGIALFFSFLNGTAFQFIKVAVIFFCLFAILSSNRDFSSLPNLAGSIFTLAIVFFGIYLIFRGIIGKRNDPDDEEHFIYNRTTRKIRRKKDWWS